MFCINKSSKKSSKVQEKVELTLYGSFTLYDTSDRKKLSIKDHNYNTAFRCYFYDKWCRLESGSRELLCEFRLKQKEPVKFYKVYLAKAPVIPEAHIYSKIEVREIKALGKCKAYQLRMYRSKYYPKSNNLYDNEFVEFDEYEWRMPSKSTTYTYELINTNNPTQLVATYKNHIMSLEKGILQYFQKLHPQTTLAFTAVLSHMAHKIPKYGMY